MAKIDRRFSLLHSILFSALVMALACLPPDRASANDEVGKAAVVKNSVSGTLSGSLSVSDAVFSAEDISAGDASHGELLLNDDSRIIVGENSTVKLDDFAVSSGGFTNATIKVTKGAFRFITGNSAKDAFKISTPLSTIGIRGTVFDVYVDGDSGASRVVLLQGALTVCTQGAACISAERFCDVIEVKGPGQIERSPFLRSAGRSRAEEKEQFQLTERQERFQANWRAPTRACSARAAQEASNAGRRGTSKGSGDQDRSSDSESENDPYRN
ncbi:MAG: FecR domain-containing protein [Rhizobiaceae bacterium]